MRSASDQLVKRAAFEQMRNVWPNARAFGQMLGAFDQCRTPKFKPAAVDELRNAFGHWRKQLREARMPGYAEQVRRTAVTVITVKS